MKTRSEQLIDLKHLANQSLRRIRERSNAVDAILAVATNDKKYGPDPDDVVKIGDKEYTFADAKMIAFDLHTLRDQAEALNDMFESLEFERRLLDQIEHDAVPIGSRK